MRNYLMFGLFILSLIFTANVSVEAQEYGTASYYSDKYQGKRTASGELYDKNKFTGAHKTLKYGTIVLVTRLDNKKSVKIRINDRGPFIKGRIIDVSRAAAEKLDLVTDGYAQVKIEVMGEGQSDPTITSTSTPSPNNQPDLKALNPRNTSKIAKDPVPTEFSEGSVGLPATPAAKTVEEATAKSVKKTVPDLKVPVKKEKPAVAKTVAAEPVYTKVRGSDFQMYDLYKIELRRPAREGFGVQVASLKQYENVMKQVAQLQEKWFNNILVSVEKGSDGNPVYKLILGPFPDKASAESYKKDLKSKKKIDGFVVSLSIDE